jgi:TonB family protein
MKTSTRIRFACVVTLALLTLSSAVVFCAAAARPLTGSVSAQTANRRARRRTTRRRRARRTVTAVNSNATTTTVQSGEVGVGSLDTSGPGAPPVDAAEPPRHEPTQSRPTIAAGVLNGKAISKPQPAYPPIAKAARAQGTVTVQIIVDESGRVISASAVSGHPLLLQAAVAAARQARFSPTLLSGQPVKVSGVITYNFVLQ